MTTDSIVYFSAADLARRYRIHKITVWKWAARGRLPKPMKLSPGTTRWRSDLIESHEAALSKQSSRDASLPRDTAVSASTKKPPAPRP